MVSLQVVPGEAPRPTAPVPDERLQRRAPVKKDKQPRKSKGQGSGSRGDDLFGDSVKVSPSDGFVEDGLGWDEMV